MGSHALQPQGSITAHDMLHVIPGSVTAVTMEEPQ